MWIPIIILWLVKDIQVSKTLHSKSILQLLKVVTDVIKFALLFIEFFSLFITQYIIKINSQVSTCIQIWHVPLLMQLPENILVIQVIIKTIIPYT